MHTCELICACAVDVLVVNTMPSMDDAAFAVVYRGYRAHGHILPDNFDMLVHMHALYLWCEYN